MRSIVPLALATFAVACSVASSEPAAALSADDGPLVLELFTSQGCSSCPPADALLSSLAAAPDAGGRRLAPLSFHVDYWDDLGWADPFARPEWTARQREYAQALGDTSVYTPELVVGGVAGIVGSRTADVRAAIARAPRVARLGVAAMWSPSALAITADAPAGTDLVVAVWQEHTTTAVSRGENAGSTLQSDRVVRALARAGGDGKRSVSLALDPSWHIGGAVVFAQRRATDRAIVASAAVANRP